MPVTLRPGLTTGPDPLKQYLAKRAIDSMPDALLTSVAKRADRLVANAPADGFVDMAELRNPKLMTLLRPPERTAVQQLTDLMEWAGVVVPAVALPTLAPLEGRVTQDMASVPVDRAAPIPVAELDSWQQAVAERLELLADDDGNGATLSLADLDQVLTHPDRDSLTTEELQSVESLRLSVKRLQGKRHPTSAPVLEVPALGTVTTELLPRGGLTSLKVLTTTTLTETQVSLGRSSHAVPKDGLVLTRESRFEFNAPADVQTHLINRQTGEVTKLHTWGAPSMQPGDYFMESWRGGQRVEQHEITVPSLPASETKDLSLHQGSALRMAQGAVSVPLHRVSQHPQMENNYYGYVTMGVKWTYGNTPPAQPLPSLSDLYRASPPARTGVYDLGGSDRIEILSTGQIRLKRAGQTTVFVPTRTTSWRVATEWESIDGRYLLQGGDARYSLSERGTHLGTFDIDHAKRLA